MTLITQEQFVELIEGLVDTALSVVRKDADGALVADGVQTKLLVNEDGRLKVATKPGSFPTCQGSLISTSVAAADIVGLGTVAGTGFVSVDVTNSSNVMIHVKNSGTATMSAGAFSFEGSLDSTNGTDGTWFTIQVARSNANTPETASGTLSLAVGAGLSYAWEASVNACSWFRVRCTTNVTANSKALWTIIRGSYATEPIPITQTHAVTGTVSLGSGNARTGFIGAGGIWYDATSAALAASATFTGTSRDCVGASTATAWAVANYADSYIVSAMSTVTGGTLYLEVSRDNTTWFRIKQSAMAQNAGGAYYAEITHTPSTRYVRAVFVNGSTAQTASNFAVQEIMRAA